jgi:phosphinothricin acetyltransferase
MIRDCKPGDAGRVAEIYNYYVAKTVVTFDEEPVSVDEIARRIEETTAEYPWLVYEEEGRILGFAYADRWKSRCAYRHSVETTVYLDPDLTGRGLGTRLYKALIDRLKNTSIHSLIGGIALPNDASIALHEKLGFEKIGQFKEVGWKFNRWVDVGYWELIFDNGSGNQD